MSTTIRGWLNQFTEATGETIDTIVLGMAERPTRSHQWASWPTWPEGTDRALPIGLVPDKILDFDIHSGHHFDTPTICAWSANWVVFIDQYDGNQNVCWVPRHPLDHHPIQPGG